MVWHDLQREHIDRHLPAERPEEALQPCRDRADQHRAPVRRAPHDVVRAGVDDVSVRFVFQVHASEVYSTQLPIGYLWSGV